MTTVDDAADAVATLDGRTAVADAEDMATAFEAAGARIAQSLDQAAQSGKLSFEGMVESVLKDMARLAVGELIEAPLTAFLDGLVGKIGRNSGGSGASPTINLNIAGEADANSFRRSEGQITASLARAVSIGRGRI